jgi:hypothetical protein
MLIRVLSILFLISANAQAASVCSTIFGDSFKIEKVETETLNGKPRYYSVRNYSHFKGGELDRYIKSIKNLTQFSEKIEEINSFIPDQSTLPSEAFFVANEIIPHIEDFLNLHGVGYKIETYKNPISGTKRSLLIISEVGSNPLNELARELHTNGKISFVIDPIELFYGYDHYKKGNGKFFDIDAFTPSYAMSFHLLLHSQRKDFKQSSMVGTDLELYEALVENKIEKIAHADPESAEVKTAEEKLKESFQDSQQEKAAIIARQIEEARKRKEAQNKKGSD